jgi:mannose-6-phosphate isomerase
MAACDYLLRFEPIFRRYLWGGRRLGTVLGKAIGEGEDYAESWEIVDHGADQSVVTAGALAGTSLGELVRTYAEPLLGLHASHRQFPLLFKFLDCNRTLSVQVHPNDEQGARLSPPDLGKTEAWVVLAAEPGSKIYAGLRHGVDRQALTEACACGQLEECLHTIEPHVGDCVFIPARTVHALGEGLLVAEIQQASDTTFRLFDWNRVDVDGRPRALHLEQSLETIDYQSGPIEPQPRREIGGELERLVDCDKFVLDRLEFSSPETIGGDGRYHLVAVIEGEIAAERDAAATTLRLGSTALAPAAAGAIELRPHGKAVILDIFER